MSWRAKPRVLRVKICSSFWKEDLTTLFTASVLPTREERQDRWSTMAIFTVNGKRVDIPSYQVSPGEVISIREKSRGSEHVKQILEKNAATMIPKWLELNRETLQGKVVALSERSDIDFDINETLIVELYSK